MDPILLIELIGFAALLGFSAFFSSSETALFSLSQRQMEQLRRANDPRTGLIERLLTQPRQLIVTILIGNELVNVAASVISAAIVIRTFGSDSKWINLLIMIPVLLLFGEITPKTLAIRNNVGFARVQCRLIDLFARAIAPLRWLVRQISEFFITLIVGTERSRINIITEDMVRSLAHEAVGDGALDREEARYINRIFDFGQKTVREVMTPRSQIAMLPATAPLSAAIAHYQETGHTKIPVHRDDRETVVGMFYARDLLEVAPDDEVGAHFGGTVADIMREAYFVPATKSVADLFYTFRKRQLSLALTIDEFGGVTGLVTMEDLLECIFGEILSHSELKRERQLNPQDVDDRTWRVDGAMTIDHLGRLMDTRLDASGAETVAGLLLESFGELPAEGSRIVIGHHEFTVEAVAGQRIAGVTVRSRHDESDGEA